MTGNSPATTADSRLDTVYRISERLDYEVDEQRQVVVLRQQDHWIQRWARRLKFAIPACRRIALDDFASFVFLTIDGHRSVKEIGSLMAEAFGNRIDPLYPRLLMFLDHLEKNERFICRCAGTP